MAQVLHFAVVDVVGPSAVSRDAQAAQRTFACGDAGRVGLERHLILTVHVADLQLAAVAQLAARHVQVFGHRARVIAAGDLYRAVVHPSDGDGHLVRCAIDTLHGEGLFLGLALAQVLHFAVVDVVGPSAVSRDAQAAQRTFACGDAGRVGLERHLILTVHVADLQLAAVAQLAAHHVQVFGHRARVIAAGDLYRAVVHPSDDDGHGRGRHTIGVRHCDDIGQLFACFQALDRTLLIVGRVCPVAICVNIQPAEAARAGQALLGFELIFTCVATCACHQLTCGFQITHCVHCIFRHRTSIRG